MKIKHLFVFALAMLLFSVGAFPALAEDEVDNEYLSYRESVRVENHNTANVMNNFGAMVNTGGNESYGGDAGNGGAGGDVNGSDEENAGGSGGDAGDGGMGGSIYSGDALASVQVSNEVNRNWTRVERTGEEPVVEPTIVDTDDEDDNLTSYIKKRIRVLNTNNAGVISGGMVAVNTGDNMNAGGQAGNAGPGGDVNGSDEENTGGAGGDAGSGSDAGEVVTGASMFESLVMNMINKNITRILW